MEVSVRFVDSCRLKPQKCVVLPQVGGSHTDGYIDTGMDIPGWDNHAYVSLIAIKEMCKFLGWPTGEDYEALAIENERLRAELEGVQERIRTVEKLEEDVKWSLEHFGSKVQKKPGRPKSEVAA